jgi:hypothetical protein
VPEEAADPTPSTSDAVAGATLPGLTLLLGRAINLVEQTIVQTLDSPPALKRTPYPCLPSRQNFEEVVIFAKVPEEAADPTPSTSDAVAGATLPGLTLCKPSTHLRH